MLGIQGQIKQKSKQTIILRSKMPKITSRIASIKNRKKLKNWFSFEKLMYDYELYTRKHTLHVRI